MKPLLLTSLFLLCLMPCKAQEKPIDAFEHDDAMWVVNIQADTPYHEAFWADFDVIKFGGDTIIDGETWKLVDLYRLPLDSVKTLQPKFDNIVLSTKSNACIRKDGNKVYTILSDILDSNGSPYIDMRLGSTIPGIRAGEPILLYDFDAVKGDTVSSIRDIVFESGEMEINGTERRYYTGRQQCLEGIGSEAGLFGPILVEILGDNNWLFLCTADGGELFRNFYGIKTKYCYDALFSPQNMIMRHKQAVWTMAKNDNGHIHSPYKITKDIPYVRVPGVDSNYCKLVTDNNYKTYCYRGENDTEGTLLYDFSLSEGDRFDNGVYSATVEKIDTIMNCGYERVRYQMSNGDCWIEGIGSIYGPLHTLQADGDGDVLLSCETDGMLYYKSPDYSLTESCGLHVNGSHNFMVPVDSLDIRPWAADFTVSFTIDFDSIKDNATTSLLGLRSREWDGTDKADRGTMWVDCINDNDTMYLSYGVRYFNDIVSDTVKLPAGFSGAHTVSLAHGTGHITESEDLYAYCLYWIGISLDGESLSDNIRTDYDVSDLWWRETSHFVIGGGLSDALPYCGTLYDFKYSGWPEINTVKPDVWWDFRSMTAEDVRDTYPGEGTLAGLQAMTGDFLSDEFIPVINKEYEGFDKDSTLTFYYGHGTLMVDNLTISIYAASDTSGLYEYTGGDIHYFDYILTDPEGKYFNALFDKCDLSEAYDVTDGIEAGDLFYGDGISNPGDTVIDVYYADGRKNIVTQHVSYSDFSIRGLHCSYWNDDRDIEGCISGSALSNNRYIQGLGWVTLFDGGHGAYHLRMLENGNKCLFANPMYATDNARRIIGGDGGSVADAKSSPASWHLPSTVASSELAITDNSGKPVCPDRVSVTSISGTVYRCAVRDDGTVDVSSLPQGFYLLTATCGDVTQTLKFIKK